MATQRERLAIGKAILRVANENPVPIADLRDLAGVSERTLISWATDGRGGVFLDAIKRGEKWVSSRAAVERFQKEREEKRNRAVEETPQAGAVKG